jgi:glutamate--cysteine ligase
MVGLYYDPAALDAAFDLVKDWNADERQKLRDDVPRVALGATIAGRSLREIGRETLAIAHSGLTRRARKNEAGHDETVYLAPLDKFIETGRVAAQDWIGRFEGAWGGSVDPAFTQACY